MSKALRLSASFNTAKLLAVANKATKGKLNSGSSITGSQDSSDKKPKDVSEIVNDIVTAITEESSKKLDSFNKYNSSTTEPDQSVIPSNDDVVFLTNNSKKQDCLKAINDALFALDDIPDSIETISGPNLSELKEKCQAVITLCGYLERDRAKSQGRKKFTDFIKVVHHTFKAQLSVLEGNPVNEVAAKFVNDMEHINATNWDKIKEYLSRPSVPSLFGGAVGGAAIDVSAKVRLGKILGSTVITKVLSIIKLVVAGLGAFGIHGATAAAAIAYASPVIAGGLFVGGVAKAGHSIYRYRKEAKALERLTNVSNNNAFIGKHIDHQLLQHANPDVEEPDLIPDAPLEPKATLTIQDISNINPALIKPLEGKMNELVRQHERIATDMQGLVRGLERVSAVENDPSVKAKLEPILHMLDTGSGNRKFIQMITKNHLPSTDFNDVSTAEPMETFKALRRAVNDTDYQTALQAMTMVAILSSKGRMLITDSYKNAKLKHQGSNRSFYTKSKTTSGVDTSENKPLIDLISSSMQCLTRLALLSSEVSNIAIATKNQGFMEDATHINKEYTTYLEKAQEGAPVNPASKNQNEMQLNKIRIRDYKQDIEKKIGQPLPEEATEPQTPEPIKLEATRLRKILNFGFQTITNKDAIELLTPSDLPQPLESLGLCEINIDEAISRGLQRKDDLEKLNIEQLVNLQEELIKVEFSTNNLQFYFQSDKGKETFQKIEKLSGYISAQIKNKIHTIQKQLNEEEIFDVDKIKGYLALNRKYNISLNSLLDFSKVIENKEFCNSLPAPIKVEFVHHFMLQKVLSTIDEKLAQGEILGEDNFANISQGIKEQYLNNIDYDRNYFKQEILEDINFLFQHSSIKNNYILKVGSFIPVAKVTLGDGGCHYLPAVTIAYAMELAHT